MNRAKVDFATIGVLYSGRCAAHEMPQHRQTLLTVDQEPDLLVRATVEGREDVQMVSQVLLVPSVCSPDEQGDVPPAVEIQRRLS